MALGAHAMSCQVDDVTAGRLGPAGRFACRQEADWRSSPIAWTCGRGSLTRGSADVPLATTPAVGANSTEVAVV